MDKVATSLKAVHIRIDGIVQGVGFRPFVYRLALRNNINGWVINRNDGVMIHAQGAIGDVKHFFGCLKKQAPFASNISSIELNSAEPDKYEGFTINKSRHLTDSITGISPDIAVCRDCLEDMKNQQQRIGYPLTNCTNCGPRFSIIRKLPYDREHTSMERFAMCTECEQEFLDPENRRFHAQPVSCSSCGPQYTMVLAGNRDKQYSTMNADKSAGQRSTKYKTRNTEENSDTEYAGPGPDLGKLCEILENGGVAAIKGAGGYNLVCNFADRLAVERIREIKGRERKPFAVMFRNVAKVREYCIAGNSELELLQSWRAPVVLLRQRKYSGHANGGLNTVGALLPYMPVHHLLFKNLNLDALVYTSANISGDPIIYNDEDAAFQFGTNTDAIISYNRDIVNPVDDSVCRLVGKNILIIRRARGFVPEMIRLPMEAEGVFAAGSDMKSSFAIGKGNLGIMSQYIGDLENYNTYCRYRQCVEMFSSMFSFKTGLVACDLHPDYHSARFAAKVAETAGSRLIRIQHHHAHIASCMAEHGLDEPVIGVCFDGTGYGDDGTIWGSEFMICDYSGYERLSHFSYIPLPGGDEAVREPWRTALSFLRISGNKYTDSWIGTCLGNLPAERIDMVDRMIAARINSPLSCGAGRLFDAVAALTGVCITAGYDGEAPMMLESICDLSVTDEYKFSDDSRAVISQVMEDLQRGTVPGIIASRFHNGMARHIDDTVRLICKKSGITRVVLSGGVFQNSFLLNRTLHLLRKSRISIYINSMVPVNDGGLALGQLVIASKK